MNVAVMIKETLMPLEIVGLMINLRRKPLWSECLEMVVKVNSSGGVTITFNLVVVVPLPPQPISDSTRLVQEETQERRSSFVCV